jgi:hypothetical protein
MQENVIEEMYKNQKIISQGFEYGLQRCIRCYVATPENLFKNYLTLRWS